QSLPAVLNFSINLTYTFVSLSIRMRHRISCLEYKRCPASHRICVSAISASAIASPLPRQSSRRPPLCFTMAQRTLAVFLFTRSTGQFVETTVPSRTTTPGGYMVAYGSQMYDALLLVPTCKEHGRVLLEEFKKANCYYLPFYPLRLGKTAEAAAGP